MNKIQKTRTSYYDVFVANDGTEFSDMEECRKYEESAKGVLNARIHKILVKTCTEEDLFSVGSCDGTIEILRPTCEEDKKTIMQMYLLKNPHFSDDKYRHYVEKAESYTDRAINEQDYLIISRGYEYDSFWFLGTCHSINENIEAFCKKEDVKSDD